MEYESDILILPMIYSSKRFRGPLSVTPQKLAYISLDQAVILTIDKYETAKLR